MEKTIVIRNDLLQFIINTLSGITLNVTESLGRRRFLKVVAQLKSNYADEIKGLIQKYADRDRSGQKAKLDETNGYLFTDKVKRQKFVDGMMTLNAIENIIAVDESNEKDLELCTRLLKEKETKFLDEKKDAYTAPDFEFLANMQDTLVGLTVNLK